MPLIKAKKKIEKDQLRINIDSNLLTNIKNYCDWAGVQKIDEFLEQAAQYILTKDKEWLSHKSNNET